MRTANEWLVTKPFDLYQIRIFKLVAEAQSFTQASRVTGLTQSAISRQIQALEAQLGVQLFVRTTRAVALTEAGQFLLRESELLLGDAEALVRRIRQDYGTAPREVRVGVSRTVSPAYLPGFFAVNRRENPAIVSRVTYDTSDRLLALVESDELDLAVLLPPPRLSERLQITHRFNDVFSFIAHTEATARVKRRCY